MSNRKIGKIMKENKYQKEIYLTEENYIDAVKKATLAGVSVEELFEKFMTDLVAKQHDLYSWYQEIIQSNEMTFLQFLIKENWLEDMLREYELLQDTKRYLLSAKESLESGLIQGHAGDSYSWKDCTDGNGNPYYANKIEWENSIKEEIETYEESIKEHEDAIHSYWEEYRKEISTAVSFTKEMQDILEWEKRFLDE